MNHEPHPIREQILRLRDERDRGRAAICLTATVFLTMLGLALVQ